MFFSTTTFCDAVENLCSKAKNGYHLCQEDINSFFRNLSFDDIWSLKVLIKDSGNIRVIKVRLPNSHQNLSSADGFRLIICCNRKYSTVTFLNIYPKRGKLAMLDQPKSEYKRQLNEYGEEFSKGQLLEYTIQ